MKGFKFAGIDANIKKNSSKEDLGLIYCDQPANAAALFTRNRVAAAPVILGREKRKKGFFQAVLVNSGNANCFTGDKGIKDADECCSLVAKELGIDQSLVFVSSTGVIGAPLPMPEMRAGIEKICKAPFETAPDLFANAILTTDTCKKIVSLKAGIQDQEFEILGIAKGSGMIRPDMATMLAYVCTDAVISSEKLSTCLQTANERSFNRISVDGDTSTNDTLLALAGGGSGVRINDEKSEIIFQDLLNRVCFELAGMIVRDGEGATKFVRIIVKGARTPNDAFKVCETIAHSNLVKTAVYGEDPNWGRITAAAGRSGVDVDPEKMDLFFDDVILVEKGRWQGVEAEKKAASAMKNKEITMTLDLNLGSSEDFFLFCDFSENYVRINADYRT